MAKGRSYKPKFRKSVKTLLKPKTTAITVLAKAVKKIENKMKQKSVYINYGQQFDNSNLSGDVDVFKLSEYSGWNRIFGTSSNDDECNKAVHKSFGMDLRFESNSETDAINFTVFLVTLKDNIRGGAFNTTNGTLSLTGNVDYYNQAGLVLLNKNSFTIHNMKRFTLGNNGVGLGSSTAQTQYGTDRRFYMKMRCNKTIQNVNGDWKALGCSQDPSDNYYLLVFNDNNILDATYPRMRATVVHTIEQLA